MSLPTPAWIALALIAWVFVKAYLATLGSFVDYRTRRHNLVRESKIKRIAYLQEMARRQGVEFDDDPVVDATGAPPQLALAGTPADPAATPATAEDGPDALRPAA
ncbi:MAG: hypothetical protein AAGA57_00965 [Planctomycetota bacterium]